MAITTETIAKYNNAQVLAALEKEREKELALIEASIKYDTTTRGLVKALNALEAQAKATEKAQKPQPMIELAAALEESTKATGAQTAAMGNLRAQLIDIGVGLQGGQNPLTILSQQGPQVAEALLASSAAGSTFVASASAVVGVAAVLALAISPVIAGYLDLRQAALDAEETQRLQSDIWSAQIPILEKVRDAQDKALEVIGLRSKAQSDDAEIEQKWAAIQEQTRATLEAKQAVLQASLHMIDETARETALANVPEKERDAILAEGNATLLERRQRLADVDQGLRELTANVQAGIDADKVAAEYKRELAAEAEREREASRKAAEAKREQAEAQRRLNEEMARVKAINDAREKEYENLVKTREAFEKLYDATEKAAGGEEERIALAARAQEAALKDAATAAKTATTSADQRLAIEADLYIGIQNIHDAEQAAYAKLEEEKTRKAEEEAKKQLAAARRLSEQQLGIAADGFGAAADLYGAMSDANAARGEKGNKKAQELAVKQFEIAKAADMVQVAMNTILSASSAAAAAPPGFKILAAASATALGVSQEVAIASQPPPTFTDTPPGGYRMSPGNQTVQGAPNDTAILFRDPIEGVLAAVAAAGKRQAPTSTPAPARRPSLGRTLATTPIPTLLTHDVARMTRGGLR